MENSYGVQVCYKKQLTKNIMKNYFTYEGININRIDILIFNFPVGNKPIIKLLIPYGKNKKRSYSIDIYHLR